MGGDGNFFVYELMSEEKIDESVKEAKAKIPSAHVSAKTQHLPCLNTIHLLCFCNVGLCACSFLESNGRLGCT